MKYSELSEIDGSLEAFQAAISTQLEVEEAGDGDFIIGYTQEAALVARMHSTLLALEKLKSKPASLCSLQRRRRGGELQVSIEYPLSIIYATAIEHRDFGLHFELHRMPAAFNALLAVAARCDLEHFVPLHQLEHLSNSDSVALKTRIDDFEREVRVALQAPGIKKIAASRRRKSNKNYASGRSLVQACFAVCSRPLSVRIDLHFLKESMGHMRPRTPEDRAMLAQQQRNYIAQLLAVVGKTFGKKMLGFQLARQYGLSKGFHYHCWFLFNGSTLRNEVAVGRLIGQAWQRVTLEQGYYYLCNKRLYKFPVTGLLDPADPEVQKGIHHLQAYLTKADELIALEMGDGRPNYQRSRLPKAARRSGRPRAKPVAVMPRMKTLGRPRLKQISSRPGSISCSVNADETFSHSSHHA